MEGEQREQHVHTRHRLAIATELHRLSRGEVHHVLREREAVAGRRLGLTLRIAHRAEEHLGARPDRTEDRLVRILQQELEEDEVVERALLPPCVRLVPAASGGGDGGRYGPLDGRFDLLPEHAPTLPAVRGIEAAGLLLNGHAMSKNTMKTFVLLAALGGLLVIGGSVLGGRGGMVIGLVIGLIFVGGSYWFSDKIAIRAAGAVPVTEAEMPDYYAIVRELTQRQDMPMPKLYVTPDMQPNAFATGRSPEHAAVAVTQGILQILDRDELRGVLAHEISHVRNRDILIGSVAAAVAMGITFLARMAMWGAMFGGGGRDDDDRGGNPIVLLAMMILAPMAAMVLQMALSRSREFEADRTGARLIGDGDALARALAKLERGAAAIPMDVQPAQASMFIVNPLTGRHVSFAGLFRTHPSTEDRVARLRSGEWRS